MYKFLDSFPGESDPVGLGGALGLCIYTSTSVGSVMESGLGTTDLSPCLRFSYKGSEDSQTGWWETPAYSPVL